jgi:hypothetical protein
MFQPTVPHSKEAVVSERYRMPHGAEMWVDDCQR